MLAFFSYDMLSFRQSLINNLRAEAQIIGANSVSALTFDDPASAAATLQGLNRSPDVVSAALTTSDGTIFANYGPPDDAVLSGKHVLAVKELEAALQIKPGNRVAIYQLMLAYGAAGREADAARMQEQMKAAIEKERQDDLRRSRVRRKSRCRRVSKK